MKKKASKAFLKTMTAPPAWAVALLIHTGIYRGVFSFRSFSPEVPVGHPYQVHERDFFYRSYKATMREAANDDLNLQDAEQYTSFGDIPFAVISGTSPIRTVSYSDRTVAQEYQQLIATLHRDWLTRSIRSKWVEAAKSGHMVPILEPELVVNEIRQMLP